METKTKSPLTYAELSSFAGENDRWWHTKNPSVVYSPGVQYLADRGAAYWLIEVIASYLVPPEVTTAGTKDACILGPHFWKLKVAEDRSAVLYADAGYGVEPFVRQEIPYTDFPLSDVAIWAGFNGRLWVLYLPSEH